MNTITLTGRLGADPEYKESKSGSGYATFNLGSKRPFKVNGQDVTDWVPCVAFGKTAEYLKNFCHKGDLVGTVGSLQVEKYEDKQGQKKSKFTVACNSVEKLSSSSASGDAKQSRPSQEKPQKNFQQDLDDEFALDDDDLPPF